MKYKWHKFESDPSVAQFMGGFCNTPTGVMTDEGGEGQPFVICHDGLNLTPEGEWIAAPGLPSRTIEEMNRDQELRCVIHDLGEQVRNARRERDELQAKLDALECEQPAAPQAAHDSATLDERLRVAEEQSTIFHERLRMIEAWATKPCVDVKLRLAQAHVLKLVRGDV